MKIDLLFIIPKILLMLSCLIGISLVPLGLPGTWLMVVSASLYAIFLNFQGGTDVRVVMILVGIAVFAEVLEFLLGIWGGKKMKASTGAIFCSVVGGLLGAFAGIPIFLIGALIGVLVGTFLGAFFYEMIVKQDLKIAFRSAWAVFFSRIISSFIKTMIALGMAVYVGMKIF